MDVRAVENRLALTEQLSIIGGEQLIDGQLVTTARRVHQHPPAPHHAQVFELECGAPRTPDHIIERCVAGSIPPCPAIGPHLVLELGVRIPDMQPPGHVDRSEGLGHCAADCAITE
jgi:hypothetical protein